MNLLLTALLVLFFDGSVDPAEQCLLPSNQNIVAEAQQLDKERQLLNSFESHFSDFFPSEQDFAQTEKIEAFMEVEGASGARILRDLQKLHDEGRAWSEIRAEYAKSRKLYNEARAEILIASAAFFESQQKDADWLKKNRSSEQLKSLIKKYQDLPLREVMGFWNEGKRLVAQKHLYAWLDVTPDANRERIISKGYTHSESGISDETLTEWLNQYLVRGSTSHPSPFKDLLPLVQRIGEQLLMESALEERLKASDVDAELNQSFREYQQALKKEFEDQVKSIETQVAQINQRFGIVIDPDFARKEAHRRLQIERAKTHIKNNRPILRQPQLAIDTQSLEAHGILNILDSHQIQSVYFESFGRLFEKSLMNRAADLGRQLGESRALNRASNVPKDLFTDFNIKSGIQSLENHHTLFADVYNISQLKAALTEIYESSARESEVKTWLKKNSSSLTEQWVRSEAHRLGFDKPPYPPVDLLLVMASAIAQNDLLTQWNHLEGMWRLNTLHRENNIHLLPLSPKSMESPLQDREKLIESFFASHRSRFPNHLSFTAFRENIRAQDDFRAGISWLEQNAQRPWNEIKPQLEKHGLLKFVSESQLRRQAAFLRAGPLQNELLRLVYQAEFAAHAVKKEQKGIKSFAEIQRERVEIMQKLDAVAKEYPEVFSMDPIFESIKEVAKTARADRENAIHAEMRKRREEELAKGFWRKMWDNTGVKAWDVLMDMGEGLAYITLGNAAQLGGYLLSPAMEGSENWGRDTVLWIHDIAETHHNGSILGSTEEMAKRSLVGMGLSIHPIFTAGQLVEVPLGALDAPLDELLRRTLNAQGLELTAREFSQLKLDDPQIQKIYQQWGLIKAVTSTAAIAAMTGGTGLATRGGALLTRAGRVIPAAQRWATSPSLAKYAGIAATSGRMLSVSGTMSAATVIGSEMHTAAKEGRPMDWRDVIHHTWMGTTNSMIFSSSLGVYSQLKSSHQLRQTFGSLAPARMSQMSVRQLEAYKQIQKRIARETKMVDIIEGLSSASSNADQWAEVDFTDWRQVLGTTLVTGSNVMDTFDVELSLKAIRWKPLQKPPPLQKPAELEQSSQSAP